MRVQYVNAFCYQEASQPHELSERIHVIKFSQREFMHLREAIRYSRVKPAALAYDGKPHVEALFGKVVQKLNRLSLRAPHVKACDKMQDSRAVCAARTAVGRAACATVAQGVWSFVLDQNCHLSLIPGAAKRARQAPPS